VEYQEEAKSLLSGCMPLCSVLGKQAVYNADSFFWHETADLVFCVHVCTLRLTKSATQNLKNNESGVCALSSSVCWFLVSPPGCHIIQ